MIHDGDTVYTPSRYGNGLMLEPIGNKMTLYQLIPLQKEENPYTYDFYNMGISVGNNIEIMYDKHSDQRARYVIIVNKETGERIKIGV